MTTRTKVIAGIGTAAAIVVIYAIYWNLTHYTIERTQYRDPALSKEIELVDDRLKDKTPAFDPDLVDSRPIREYVINASAAVVRLDCPTLRHNIEALSNLRPSYADAIACAGDPALRAQGELLPSANMLDGAAKQVDDGLYAALDLAFFEDGLGDDLASPVTIVRRIFDALPPDSPARAFLGAGLSLAGKPVNLSGPAAAAMRQELDRFERSASSKPISFYAWTENLGRVWRFFKFLQEEFDAASPEIRDIARVLEADAELRERYRRVNAFYGRLTNPLICLPVDALVEETAPFADIMRKHGARRPTVAVLPPSTSRETELFDAMFPMGVPAGVNMMTVLINKVRSGEVDLSPGPNSGWYQYQVHALETLLLPQKGRESEKLLLTAKYKRRLVEAFKALITKRRETHARQLAASKDVTAMPPQRGEVKPRLRIEPLATFYLRTARAYAFLEGFLESALGADRLAGLHGMKKDGRRTLALADELADMKVRFYGFYLIACEDIGLRPQFLPGEAVDQSAAVANATTWLDGMADDEDLGRDTRVSVPIYIGEMTGTRLWATLGVRLARLEATYVRPPSMRPTSGGEWQQVDPFMLDTSSYLIAVDEFAELTLKGAQVLTRDELRAICDEHETKERIIEAVSRR